MTEDRRGRTQFLEKTMARTRSARGKYRGKQSLQDVIRWLCARQMRRATRNPMSRSGIPGDTCGTASSGRNLWLEMRAKERTTMRNRAAAILVVACGVPITGRVAFPALKTSSY